MSDAATPIDANDRVDDDILARYPYPLASTYSRAFFQSADPTDIHEYLLDLFEVTLKYCAAVAMANYLQDQAWDAKISGELLELRRPSLGQWQGWLRDILALYERENRTFLVPELPAFYRTKHGGAIVEAAQVLQRQMQTLGYGGPSVGGGGLTTQQFFDLLVGYRNRLAHGARPNPRELQRATEVLAPALRQLYTAMGFVAEYRLVHVRSVTLEFDSKRRQRYRYVLTRLTGDTPRVVSLPQALDTPFPNKQVYLLHPSADFQPILSLQPLLILEYCDGCDREQVFVLNMSDKARQDYLAYQCAHHYSPTEYLDYMRQLIDTLETAAGAKMPDSGPADVNVEASAPSIAEDSVAKVDASSLPTACPRCGKNNVSGAKFCGQCGARLAPSTAEAPPSPPAAVACRFCAAPLAAGIRFCGKCGRPV
jgi:hypothetical protein